LLLKKLNQQYLFVSFVLQAIDGEKDPRNLIYTFDLVFYILRVHFQENSKPLQDVSVDAQILEDLFDAVSRYFPINFSPPKNDSNKITPEKLQGLLSRCMLASPKLCHLFLPFLQEKLAAKATKTKIASLNLITKILENFDYKHYGG
jgi:DNA repair/transcription protein MET18/MMS19